jgi:DNA-binding transcriptional MerR regulator
MSLFGLPLCGMQQLSLFEQMQQLQADKRPIEVDESALSKVYYTITEVAEMFHVNASLLRFWEKEFPVQLGHLKKNKKGDRFYNKQDIGKLKLIFHLVKEKRLTLEGARDYLKSNRKKVKDDQSLIENLEKVKAFLVDLKKNLNT